jgi:hypothetical protein
VTVNKAAIRHTAKNIRYEVTGKADALFGSSGARLLCANRRMGRVDAAKGGMLEADCILSAESAAYRTNLTAKGAARCIMNTQKRIDSAAS